MEIVSQLVGTSTASGQEVTSPQIPELGREVFLRLLVTQLQSQDPTNPVQNEDFVAQLAQFTTLEQTNNTNDLLENLISQVHQRSQFDQVALIGHEVTAKGSTVLLGETGDTTLGYVLSQNAVTVNIDIVDSKGNLVKTLTDLGPQPVGQQDVVWDGNTSEGDGAEPGTYAFNVRAEDSQGNPISAMTFMRDIVKAVVWGSDSPLLSLGSGKTLVASEILSVH